jgi:hypothetical protein
MIPATKVPAFKPGHDAPENVLYEYYAKNVGLIKREFLLLADGEPYSVTSSLKSISCPLAQ